MQRFFLRFPAVSMTGRDHILGFFDFLSALHLATTTRIDGLNTEKQQHKDKDTTGPI